MNETTTNPLVWDEKDLRTGDWVYSPNVVFHKDLSTMPSIFQYQKDAEYWGMDKYPPTFYLLIHPEELRQSIASGMNTGVEWHKDRLLASKLKSENAGMKQKLEDILKKKAAYDGLSKFQKILKILKG